MAIFQPTFERKAPIDDTLQLQIIIETSQKIHDHTVRYTLLMQILCVFFLSLYVFYFVYFIAQEYILKVQRGPNKENFWKLSRR